MWKAVIVFFFIILIPLWISVLIIFGPAITVATQGHLFRRFQDNPILFYTLHTFTFIGMTVVTPFIYLLAAFAILYLILLGLKRLLLELIRWAAENPCTAVIVMSALAFTWWALIPVFMYLFEEIIIRIIL